VVDQVQAPVQSNPAPQGPPNASTSALATRTIDENRTPGGGVDASGLRRDLDRIRAQDPELAGWVAAEVDRQLTPVQRGELAAAGYSIQAPDGTRLSFQPNAPSVSDYRAMAPGSEGRAFYDRLDRAFGDGNPATDDTPAIQTGLNDLVASGGSLDQLPAGTPTPANDQGPSTATMVADLTQLGLDIVGIFEPTPFADASNAVISVGRAIFEWDASRLIDAGASAAGILPYLGDTAKLAKVGRWAETVANGVQMAARSPAMREAIEPALRGVHDAVKQIPQGVLDQLPASAREAIERMRTQLDEFFGAGARVGDDANVGRTVRINGQEVRIGDAPTVGRAADGTPTARNVNGDEVRLRQPATYDSRTPNPDGTVTYTRGGNSVRYDANGFPVFNSRADVYLPTDKLAVGSRSTHFDEANRLLARNSDDQLRAAGFNNAEIAQLRRGETPDNMTWHHHQDVGRMQLVRRDEHATFSGGHTGGWSLWGDSRRFTIE
jgi:hypothetical protein